MTLKSHTEQVIQKFRKNFSWLIPKLSDDCDKHIIEIPKSEVNGLPTLIFATPEELEAFLVTALKELSDLQAEETRVEKTDEEVEQATFRDESGSFCGGRISAIEEQEKLSNAFRNL